MDQYVADLKAFGAGLNEDQRAKLHGLYKKLIKKQHGEEDRSFRLTLPDPIITKSVIKEMFPDEISAIAYLMALKNNCQTLLQIENIKDVATNELRRGSPSKWRRHPELLGQIFGLSAHDIEMFFKSTAIKMAYEFMDDDQYFEFIGFAKTDFVDEWLSAKITNSKMVQYVRGLNPNNIESKESLIKGTYLEKVPISLNQWIMAVAVFAQANQSLTGKSLMFMFNGRNRNRPVAILKALREIAEKKVREEFVTGRDVKMKDNWLGVSLSMRNQQRQLFFQLLAQNSAVNYLNSNGIQSIGKLSIDSYWDDMPDHRFPRAQEAKGEVRAAFNKWISPHRRRCELQVVLPEFVYRYNMERQFFLGWSLINPLLRELLKKVIV